MLQHQLCSVLLQEQSFWGKNQHAHIKSGNQEDVSAQLGVNLTSCSKI